MRKSEIISYGKKLGIKLSDIERVIMYNTGLSKNQYFLVDKIDNYKSIITDLVKISGGLQLEYLLSKSEFYARKFYVDNRVLIPRNDTETLINAVLQNIKNNNVNLVDVGTGSGIIAITSTLELLENNINLDKILALDISEDALIVAKKNIINYKLEDKISLNKSNLLEYIITNNIFKKDDKVIIMSNLPYIKNKDYGNMDISVIDNEPNLALYGGIETGFELYEELINQIVMLANRIKNIELYIEIGFDQKRVASNFLLHKKLNFEFFKDNAKIDRVVRIYGF